MNPKASYNLILPVLFFWFLSGCGYPEVSGRAYEISKALYAACNLENEERLAAIDELIKIDAESGQLSASEARWLTGISQKAHTGEWREAALEARKLIEDQVRSVKDR